MARQQYDPSKVKDTKTRKSNYNAHGLKLLHHNVQSLSNKLTELSITLSLEETSVDVLCFTEHWLSEYQLSSIYIDQYKLVSSFSRSSRLGGGSSIFVKKTSCRPII
jgi:exonuclease III